MAKTKRRYVYEKTYQDVMEWAKKQDLRSPNAKENFPFYLEQFLNHLNFKLSKK